MAMKRQEWNSSQILALAFLSRILLVCYGRVHDYLFDVSFFDEFC